MIIERLERLTNVQPFVNQEMAYVDPLVRRDVGILVTQKTMLEAGRSDIGIEWQFGIWPKTKCSYCNGISGKWAGDS
jgi:hypothetical protein